VFKNLIQGVQSPSWRLPRLAGERCPTWLTSGAGSVILLNGQPGDPIVSLHHLKQPAAAVGPLQGPSLSGKRPLQDLAHDVWCR
jgi:hypothetical protein